MARFATTRESEAVVAAAPQQIWAVLVDPDLLARLTPFLRRIDVDGDHWRWTMTSVGALGVSLAPAFTVRMDFDEPHGIDFVHDPPEGVHERAGVDGRYRLAQVDGGTRLSISLRVEVELPLSRLASPAVVRVMRGVIATMGDRFAANLCDHLGVPRT